MSIHEHLDALMLSNEALWGRLISSDKGGGISSNNNSCVTVYSNNATTSNSNADDEIVRTIADIRERWKLATAAAKTMFESNMQCVAHIMQLQKEKSIKDIAYLKELDTLNNRIQSLLCIVDHQQQEVELCKTTLSLRNLWKRLISSILVCPSDHPDHRFAKQTQQKHLDSSSSNFLNYSSSNSISNNNMNNDNFSDSNSNNGDLFECGDGVIKFIDLLENSSSIITLLSLLCSKEMKSTSSPLSDKHDTNGESLMSILISKLSVLDRFISDEVSSIKLENLDLRNKIHSKSLQMEQLQHQYCDYNHLQQRCSVQSQELNNLKIQSKRLDIENNQEMQRLKLRLDDAEAKLAAVNARNNVLESQYKDTVAIAEHWQKTCRNYHSMLYAKNSTHDGDRGGKNDNIWENDDDFPTGSMNRRETSQSQIRTPSSTYPASDNNDNDNNDNSGDVDDNNALSHTNPIYDANSNNKEARQTDKKMLLPPGMSLFDNKSIYDHALSSTLVTPPPSLPLHPASINTGCLPLVISDLSTQRKVVDKKHLSGSGPEESGKERPPAKLPWDSSRRPSIEVKATKTSALRSSSNILLLQQRQDKDKGIYMGMSSQNNATASIAGDGPGHSLSSSQSSFLSPDINYRSSSRAIGGGGADDGDDSSFGSEMDQPSCNDDFDFETESVDVLRAIDFINTMLP